MASHGAALSNGHRERTQGPRAAEVVGLGLDRLQYQMIFTATDTVAADQLQIARRFVDTNRT